MEELIVTPGSRRIAESIVKQMAIRNMRPSQLEHALKDQLSKHTIRRIRNGSSGATLRAYEYILDCLGLQITITPKPHPAVKDDEYFHTPFVE